jgi:hypothetical protein
MDIPFYSCLSEEVAFGLALVVIRIEIDDAVDSIAAGLLLWHGYFSCYNKTGVSAGYVL